MPEAITISAQAKGPERDYDNLREAGMKQIRALSGNVWTDHNVHDPGITILELFCYALTDLGYRATLPMEDLAAMPEGNTLAAPLFTAKKILPARSLTLTDYRKLLIDTAVIRADGTVAGVRNAWLARKYVPVVADLETRRLQHAGEATTGTFQTVQTAGRYKVLLEYDSIATTEERDELKHRVRQKLHAARNLCEVFDEIEEVTQTSYRICGELELEAAANPFETLAEMALAIQEYLSPPVHFYSLRQMRDAGVDVDAIFDGPVPESGFLKTAEVQQAALRSRIMLSDIIRCIMNTRGITDAREVVVQPAADTGVPEGRWIWEVPEGTQPVLDLLTSRFVLYKNGYPFVPDKVMVYKAYHDLLEKRNAAARNPGAEDLPPLRGKYRSGLGTYTALRHHFPLNYGITDWGLPLQATDPQKAKALQLQGYLWLADQLLINFPAQLARFSALMSCAPVPHVLQPDMAEDLLPETLQSLFPEKAVAKSGIAAALESEKAFTQRRHALLDHLLARFAEPFAAQVHTRQARHPLLTDAEMMAAKEAFLQQYDTLGMNRYGAINYAAFNGSLPRSGWENRFRHIAGLAETDDLLLIEHILLLPPAGVNAWLGICRRKEDFPDCTDFDPYSFRVSLLLCAESALFSAMDYRIYTESLARMELPAHLLPKICWVTRSDMDAVKEAWTLWLEVLEGSAAPQAETRLNNLVQLLESAKSIYPESKLQDCSTTEEKQLLILNKSTLGTQKND